MLSSLVEMGLNLETQAVMVVWHGRVGVPPTWKSLISPSLSPNPAAQGAMNGHGYGCETNLVPIFLCDDRHCHQRGMTIGASHLIKIPLELGTGGNGGV